MKLKNSLKIIKLVKPLILFMVIAITMGIIGHLMASFITILGGYGIIGILNNKEVGSLITILVIMLVIALLRGVFRYGEQLCNHYVAFKLLATIRDKVFKALRKLAPAKLEVKEKGNLVSLITSDVELLEVFYAHTISPIMIAFGTSLVMTIFIGSFNFILGIISGISYFVIGVIIPLIFSKLSGNDGENYRKKSGDLSSNLYEGLRGLREDIQYQNGDRRYEKINNLTRDLIKAEEKMKRNTWNNGSIVNILITIFSLLIIFVGMYLNLSFEIILIAFLSLISSFGPVLALASLGSSLQNTFGSMDRIVKLLEEEPIVGDIVGNKDIKFKRATCENIYFNYPSNNDRSKKNILDNLSINIDEKSIVGLKGESGSGKSTLIKLLMRFFKVSKGEVKISDTNIGSINTSNLRNIEGYMTQEVGLFNDTIRNNIKIARENASDNEVEEACKKASVHNFILSLPKGYDTKIGELGGKLSSGEKQRLSLARCFLHNSEFMLLDEPTSNLDVLNEGIILKALIKEREDRTILISSHRRSTLNIGDRIYELKGGRCNEK